MKRHAAPFIAAVLLLLPVLYVGSYLALVVPGDQWKRESYGNQTPPVLSPYRLGGDRAEWFYCPLEQIDRKVRPGAWESPGTVSPNGFPFNQGAVPGSGK